MPTSLPLWLPWPRTRATYLASLAHNHNISPQPIRVSLYAQDKTGLFLCLEKAFSQNLKHFSWKGWSGRWNLRDIWRQIRVWGEKMGNLWFRELICRASKENLPPNIDTYFNRCTGINEVFWFQVENFLLFFVHLQKKATQEFLTLFSRSKLNKGITLTKSCVFLCGKEKESVK